MPLEALGRVVLFIDLIAAGAFIMFAWLDLRRQTTDLGKVGGATILIALCFVFYLIGSALFGT